MSSQHVPDTGRTTIYDIARLADTSPSTVSSVLNGTWQKRRISQKLADRVMGLAEELGYAVNAQASLLRKEQSNIIGMIMPKFDNRYFGAIAERFESQAREHNLFPVITCTERDPELELEAAKKLISYQAKCLIATGATDPDRISALCRASGVQSINMDLPGQSAPSVISDNYRGAYDLTKLLLDRCQRELGSIAPLLFLGGRLSDHNTAARRNGFLDAQRERGLVVPDTNIMANGYSAQKALKSLDGFHPGAPVGIFVNSTITLEGLVSWYVGLSSAQASLVRYGCFDWDPFGTFLPGNVGMVQQDVESMLVEVFKLVDSNTAQDKQILIPCLLRENLNETVNVHPAPH